MSKGSRARRYLGRLLSSASLHDTRRWSCGVWLISLPAAWAAAGSLLGRNATSIRPQKHQSAAARAEVSTHQSHATATCSWCLRASYLSIAGQLGIVV